VSPFEVCLVEEVEDFGFFLWMRRLVWVWCEWDGEDAYEEDFWEELWGLLGGMFGWCGFLE
jgi:hypothetical protein